MSIEEENVSLIRKQVTTLNEKDYEEMLKDMSPEFVRHDLANAIPGVVGIAGASNSLQMVSAGFSDLQLEIIDIFYGGDRAAMRYIARGSQDG